MSQHTIPLEGISKLVIKQSGGNLYLTGWSRDEIRIKDLTEQDLISDKKDRVEITFPNDGVVHIPHHLPVTIESVANDASIKDIESPIEISAVGRDLTLSNVNPSIIDSVGSDLYAKRIQGDLVIKSVGRDCFIENVKGQLSLKQVGRDLVASKVSGGIEAKIGGDGQVSLSPVPWQAYRIEVGGDLSVVLPDGSNADLSVQSKKKDLTIRLGNLDEKVKSKDYKAQIGEGGPTIMLSAGGKVFVAGDDLGWFSGLRMDAKELEHMAVDLSAQTAEQIKNSLSNLEEDLQVSLSSLTESLDLVGLSEENLQQIKIQIKDSSRMAAQKAELAATKAQAKLEKNLAKTKRTALKLKRKSMEFDLDQFLSSNADKRSVSDGERLMILNMLQNKKISPSEADDLLKALEGKEKR